MRRYIKIFVFVLLLIPVCSSFAQQQPFYSQYMLDKFLVNPAIAGANGFTSINFVSRQQFVGLEKAPQTFAITAQGRILDDSYIMKRLRPEKKKKRKSRSGKVGIGGSIYNDRNGIISRTGFQGTYAYHIDVNNMWQISGGLSLQGFQYRVNDEGVPVATLNDPLLNSEKRSGFVADANAGIFATNGTIYGGITMTDILGSNFKISSDDYTDYEMLRKYNILAGYRFELSPLLMLEPSVLLQGTRTNLSADFNARIVYLDQIWAGLSYRSNKSMIVMLGAQIDRFFFGYAYDVDMGLIRSYSAGSHEVVLGVRLGENNTRRFRWFRQDERRYDI